PVGPPPPANPTPPIRLRTWLLAASVLVAIALTVTETTGVTGLVGAAATVLRIRTPEGTLVVEFDDPQIRVNLDGEDLVIAGPGPREVRVRAGQHRAKA